MNVLVACEESQRVCEAFRKRGHNAFSCDIVDCSGGHSEWHFKQDVLQVIPNFGGKLQNGEEYYLPEGEEWDLMVAHPLHLSMRVRCCMVLSPGRQGITDRTEKTAS